MTRSTAPARAVGLRSDRLAFAMKVAAGLRLSAPFDLVHLHGDQVEASVLGPVCRSLALPLVVTVHGALARRHRALARRALTRRALRDVDAFIALGSRTAADLIGAGAEPYRIITMSSGLDLRRIARLPDPPARRPGLVVSVGSLEPVKNHALLIEAVRTLRASRPGLSLVVAGDGPDAGRLRALAGGGPGIAFAGRLPQDEVYRLVASAEVFVLASCRLPGKGEGVPTAALEALALGTPVIVSSEAVLDPVVPDPGTYRTFRSGSAGELARVLGSVLDDPEGRRRMSALGRVAATGLDWPVIAGRVEEAYALALGRPAPEGART